MATYAPLPLSSNALCYSTLNTQRTNSYFFHILVIKGVNFDFLGQELTLPITPLADSELLLAYASREFPNDEQLPKNPCLLMAKSGREPRFGSMPAFGGKGDMEFGLGDVRK